jgi:hypothetical protein
MEKLTGKYPFSPGAKFDLASVRPSIERYTQRVRRLRDYIANCVLQRTFTFNRKTDRQYIEFRDAAKLRHSTLMEEYLDEFKPAYDLVDALEGMQPYAPDILQPQN